jgi:hypothetical protein
LSQVAQRIFIVGERTLERRKIMRADEIGCGLLHGRQIERLIHMPDVGPVESGPFPSIQNAVLVQLPVGRIAGMEVVGHRGGGTHGDIVRKPRIQSTKPFARHPLLLDPEARDLTERVHARIRSPCADHRYGFLGQLEDGGFNGFLNGRLIGLALPARVARTVVFQHQPYRRHGGQASGTAAGITAPAVLTRPGRR